MTAQSGGVQPLVVATFGASTAWCGKTIVFSDGVFLLEDHGPIRATDVLTYDGQGHLSWAYDGLREWVVQCAEEIAAVPVKSAAGDGDQILVFDTETSDLPRACIDGRGFGIRREDMRRLLIALEGKVFTLATLGDLVAHTELARFAT